MKVLISALFTVFMIMGAAARADVPSVHGMLLFGHEAAYASHLPMFHAPHDYQLILKIKLAGGATTKAYEQAKMAGKTLFTLEPERMDLIRLISGDIPVFSAVVYDGHFERGGVPLGNVQVLVEKVVYSKKLVQEAPLRSRRYLVFGEKGEYFAAHMIQGKPSFDVILKVSQPYTLEFHNCRTRVCAEPLKTLVPDSHLPLMNLAGPATAAEFNGDQLESIWIGNNVNGTADAIHVVYLEEGDLSH